MRAETNQLCRLTVDQALACITAITNTFQTGRSDAGLRNDLDRAQQHLTAALNTVDDAIATLPSIV